MEGIYFKNIRLNKMKHMKKSGEHYNKAIKLSTDFL